MTRFQCRLCDCRDSKEFLKRDAKSGDSLPISFCIGCGLVQQTTLPSDEDLRIYYSHNYRRDYKKTYHPKPKYVRRAGITGMSRLSFLARHVGDAGGRKLIDIGAGGGEFVYLAKQSGFDASGFEPNEGYSEFAVEEYAVNITTAGIDEIPGESADLVTLFHVFEHLAHPLDAMEKISRILRDEGHLLVEVPNILQKDASPHNIFFKAHLFYYCRFTLTAAASRWFETVHIEDSGNLMILFKKRREVLVSIETPSEGDVRAILYGLGKKGWIQYLFSGGGLLKPIHKLARATAEGLLGKCSPKQILDDLASFGR
jgi:SAM-dependent methyltransferase